MLSRDLEIHHYKDNNELEVALHSHDFYEILFFISGNVTFSIESKNYIMLPGDILLISPLELHRPVLIQAEQQPYERIVLWVSKALLDAFISSSADDITTCFDTKQPNHTNLIRLPARSQEFIRDFLEKIIAEKEGSRFANQLLVSCYLGQVLVEVNRALLETPERFVQTDNSNQIIKNILNYINEHYGEHLSLDLLSSMFFTNKYHLSHEFNKTVGTSVYRYIIQKRLIMAKQMLISGTSPTSVFRNCGFSDYANFYRAFKSEYGISPKEFVKSVL